MASARHSTVYPVENTNINMNMGMRAIPSMYFRPPSPHTSRASTAYQAAQMNMHPLQFQRMHLPTGRSTASSAASATSSNGGSRQRDNREREIVEKESEWEKEWEKEREMERELERREFQPKQRHREAPQSEGERDKGKEREREKRVPVAPKMRRRGGSSSSSSGSSWGYSPRSSYTPEQPPPAPPSRPKTPIPSTPLTRVRSRRHSVSASSSKPSVRFEDDRGRSKNMNAPPSTSAPSNSIPHLREAINTLESQMASLMNERRELETRLENAVRQQSPVQRLPGELLGSIFDIGVHHMEEEDTLLLSTLMLVCKDWTEVALKTPVLWSRIIIDGPNSLPKARRKLSRSGAVPLDISIQFSPHAEHTVIETVVHALDLLRPSLWRWRTFKLAVPTRNHASAALSQCRDPAPLLETFVVHVHHVLNDEPKRPHHLGGPGGMNGVGGSNALLPLFQGRSPRLRVASFTSFNFGWDSTLFRRLRVLRLNGYWHAYAPSVSVILDVLRACPGLEELALRNMSDVDENPEDEDLTNYHNINNSNNDGGCYYADPDEDVRVGGSVSGGSTMTYSREDDMIRLTRLKHASFYYSGPMRTQAIFAQIEFPALEDIEFSYMDNVTPILKHLKRQAITGSLPLKRMRIEASLVNELKLVRVLRRLPTMKTLELVDAEDVSSHFLNALSGPTSSQNEWICPNLEALNFDGCNALAWDSLRSLVESRLPASASARISKPSSSSSSGSGSGNRSSIIDNGNGPYAPRRHTNYVSSASSSASSYAAQRSSSLPSLPTQSYSSASASASASTSSFGSSSARYSAYSSASGAASTSSFVNINGVAGGSRNGNRNRSASRGGIAAPCRLKVIDLTRCAQISKEMIQWLRMYVDDVRCESERTYWGEL